MKLAWQLYFITKFGICKYIFEKREIALLLSPCSKIKFCIRFWDDIFADALRITQDNLDSKNFYAFNPAFDMGRKK